jgi:two-component system chemotaxis sensor kinase CheA
MGPQRSAALSRWFGEAPPSGHFGTWLEARAPGFGPHFEVAFAQLVEGLMPLDVCVELLPRALACGGRHFALGYQALTAPGGETLLSLLVVISDVTAEVGRRRAAEEQREVVEVFQWLMRDRPGFASFLAEGSVMVARLAAGSQTPSQELREVHTLKGNSALLGVRSVAGLCDRLESRLAEEGGTATAAERSALQQVWASLLERVGTLGGTPTDAVPVPLAELEELLAKLGRGAPARELLALAASWKDEPAINRLRLLADQARALSRRLERGEPEVVVESDGVRLPHERFAAFWGAAVHVVRNAVDHGFEAPAERLAAGKPPPRLTLACRRVAGALQLTIADDGRGVPWEALAVKARARGLPAETRAQLVDVLCADGLSSRDQATETSGRGVGMAAVRQAVEALGGTLGVESSPGQGTTFTFLLPLAGATPCPWREVA